MSDIFLSYSRRDSSIMAQVRDSLRASNLIVWTDENLVPGTPEWQKEIEKAIEMAGAIVVILSPDANQSTWVNREIMYAQNRQKRIFPILVRGSKEDSVPLSLVDMQFVDARFSPREAIEHLALAVKQYIGLKERTARFLDDIHELNRGRGWQQTTFGQAVKFFNTKRIQISEENRSQGPFPYYGAAGIIDYIHIHLYDGEHLLVTATSSNLLTRRHPIAFRANGQFAVNTSAHVLAARDGFSLDFLMYYLWITDLKPYVTGSVIPHLTKTKLSSMPLAHPDYAEQLRLAKRISEQLSTLEQVRISLEQQLQVIADRPIDILHREFTPEA